MLWKDTTMCEQIYSSCICLLRDVSHFVQPVSIIQEANTSYFLTLTIKMPPYRLHHLWKPDDLLAQFISRRKNI